MSTLEHTTIAFAVIQISLSVTGPLDTEAVTLRFCVVHELVGWCSVWQPSLPEQLKVVAGLEWTEEELQVLQEAIQQHSKEDGSIGWSAVAAKLPGRTDKDVKRQHANMLAR